MFDRTSETGWFEYSGSDVPDEVVAHLESREDVTELEETEEGIEFLSDNSSLAMDLYDEDGEDGFTDYGVMSSSPVRNPSALPERLRKSVSVEEFVDDSDLARYLRSLGIGDDDPREYTLNGRFSLRLDAWRDREYEPPSKSLEPMALGMVQAAADDGLVEDNERVPYPSVEQMSKWSEAFTSEFEKSELYAIGGCQGRFMFDGVVVRVDVDDAVREWVRDRFEGGEAEFSRASEVQFYDDKWVRLWWD